MSSSNLCQNCHSKPKATHGPKTHDYCSKTCAQMAGALGSTGSNSNGTCQTVGCYKPVWVDTNGVPSNWCGRQHMSQARGVTTGGGRGRRGRGGGHGTVPVTVNIINPSSSQEMAPPRPTQMQMVPTTTTMPTFMSQFQPKTHAYPNVTSRLRQGVTHPSSWSSFNPVSTTLGGIGNVVQGLLSGSSSFQGLGAATSPPMRSPTWDLDPATLCLWCKQRPQLPSSPFCGTGCVLRARDTAPGLLPIPSDHPTFKSVENQFKLKWVNPNPPFVKHVYIVLVSTENMQSYENYRERIEFRRQCVNSGREAGNQQRRWHGTRRSCNVGDPGNTYLCSSTTCSLCCIMRTSFDVQRSGSGSFGKGIYTSSTSSKAGAYISNNSNGSNLNAILLNKVVVGRGYQTTSTNSSLTAPPPGYDSVLGQLGSDELIVYNNDAIRPAYLVMYE